MRIGLFDSGIGGLNVLKEFLKVHPNHEYYYFGDTKNVPYGNKDKKTLLELSSKIIKFFEQQQVSLIIIACGTISSNCFLELKQLTKIPIISIIPSTIDYVKQFTKQKIALLGTKGTVATHLFSKSLNKDILEIAPVEFVPMIEANQIKQEIILKYAKLLLDYDVIILGCTHYPLIANNLKKYLKKDVIMIDMGKILAQNIKLDLETKKVIKLYFSKIDKQLIANITKIIKEPIILEEKIL